MLCYIIPAKRPHNAKERLTKNAKEPKEIFDIEMISFFHSKSLDLQKIERHPLDLCELKRRNLPISCLLL